MADARPIHQAALTEQDFFYIFLNHSNPFMPLVAICICYFGAMALASSNTQDSLSWPDDSISSVSGLYGPGSAFSWMLASVSLIYDMRGATNAFDIIKYFGVISYSFVAVWDMVKHANSGSFGPSFAAALYMSDKTFEGLALLWCLRTFPVSRVDKRKPRELEPVVTESNSRRPRYKMGPVVVLFTMWLLGRMMTVGRVVYDIGAQDTSLLPVSWPSLLPTACKPLCILVAFGISIGICKNRGWSKRTWGIPVGIQLSFVLLHSGIFGTLGWFRMTDKRLGELDQIFPLISIIVLLVLQYAQAAGKLELVTTGLKDLFNIEYSL